MTDVKIKKTAKAYTNFASDTGEWMGTIGWYREPGQPKQVRVIRESDWRKIKRALPNLVEQP